MPSGNLVFSSIDQYGKSRISKKGFAQSRDLFDTVIVVLLFGFIAVFNSTVLAQTKPVIDANAWVLMEINSGSVVVSQNAEVALPPASITKLMMNYVIFDRLKSGDLKSSDQVPISEYAWRAEGSRMFADVNTRIELGHLLKSTIIQSGNDASIALAEFTGGSEFAFAQLMNQEAKKLGLNQSNFVNSTGLPDEGHLMSALDIAKLSGTIIKDYPEFYTWYSVKEYSHNNITQYNRNKLLWKDDSVDGLKTGFTDEAGYCLVGSAIRDKQRWIAVVLGAKSVKSREAAVLELLNYGFNYYDTTEQLNQQGGLTSVKVYGGEADQVLLQATAPANVVVAKGRKADIKVILHHSPYFQAPIEVGQPMGLAQLTLDGETLVEVPLVATSEIKLAGWWKRLVDSIKLSTKQFLQD
ncbi:MAG: D-alanyl-D-alanine carboxypeptidase (penicillin-binding protein 5/6) [Arenicella sp.]|jgi:D-alanyl-D-alanine carboxypeptidase (penicillin-binding protein 5/6)